MYQIIPSRSYKKSLKKLNRSKNFKIQELEKVVNILMRGSRLEKKYQDHQLLGNLSQFRECHVQNDILLVYMYKHNDLILILSDVGTHASIFG